VGNQVYYHQWRVVGIGKARMRFNRFLVSMVTAAGLIAVAGSSLMAGQDDGRAAAKTELFGNTVPSEKAEMTLSSRTSDVVLDIKVKRGDIIKPGQVLAIGDVREEEAELKGAELLANSSAAIDAAKVTRDHRELKVQRMAKGGTNFSDFERREAQLDLDLAELEITAKQLEQERAKAQVDVLRARIASKQIVSRIGGIVREINIEKGGVIDPQKPAFVIVNNNPLWVDVPLPVRTSLELARIQRSQPDKKIEFGILYPGAAKPIPAKVIYFDPVADPVGHSQLVTLEVPNPDQLPAGLQVQVIVPDLEKVAEANVK
jgi:multidrug efflux pump subunit AcrA (membrane-fusion protein)